MTAPECEAILGVEFGGSSISLVVGLGPDSLLAQRCFPMSPPDEALRTVETEIRALLNKHTIRSIGIASFGPMDLDPASTTFGTIVNSSKTAWSGVNLYAWARQFELPVHLNTDVAAPALAEGLWGAARGLRSWAYVLVDSGIGVGLIVGGRPLSGLLHPEAGHLLVPNPGTFEGNCPFHGACVEGLASSRAIAAQTGNEAQDLPADHAIWLQVACVLGSLCHNLMLSVGPQMIIIGGSVINAQPHLLSRITRELRRTQNGFGLTELATANDAFIVRPALGPEAGSLGALAIALPAQT